MSTTTENTETATTDAPTVSEQVNEILKAQETSKLVLPEGVSEHVADVARAEHKFRSTQSSYTKASQRTRELEAENEVLKGHVKAPISDEEAERLKALKYTDPDAWKAELDALESKKPDIGAEARAKAGESYELERRVDVLTQFNTGREVPITDEVIMNDVPPRISNKLANNEVTFEEFLAEVDSYLAKGKALPTQETLDQTDLNKVTGGDTPHSKGKPTTETGKYVDIAQSDTII